jgi:hypothetical protein
MSAPFYCLKILVDKQDNGSIAINNNPRDIALFFVLRNLCQYSELVFEGVMVGTVIDI